MTKQEDRNAIFRIIFLAVFLILIGSVYIIYCSFFYRVGFPLDDTWIHLTYARNLALSGDWFFQSNDYSAGSTSPLWTIILSFIYLISNNPHVTGYTAGLVSLFALAWFGQKLADNFEEKKYSIPYIGIFIILEWHITWSSVSGMETVFFCFLIILFFFCVSSSTKPNWFFAGLFSALAIWTRPDGLTLLLPAFILWVAKGTQRRDLILFVLGWAPIIIGYFVFNYSMSGNFWPNTLYAKQAEYAILLNQSIITRFLQISVQPFIGPTVVLIPGLIYFVYRKSVKREFLEISGFCWLLCYLLIYSLMLPVTYQHGRYIIPIIPIIIIFGCIGTSELIKQINSLHTRKLVLFSMKCIIVGVLCVFSFIGCSTFARDVSIIEAQMVDMAIWVSENTVLEARIAAHDIGALGYFGNRYIIDLGGLIQPEIVPIIRDEFAITLFLVSAEADYLIVFPSWYPRLVENLEIMRIANSPPGFLMQSDFLTLYHLETQ